MNWGLFKDPLYYLCAHGAVVSYLSLKQEVAGLGLPFYKNIVNEFTEFSESHLGKTPLKPIRIIVGRLSYSQK